MQRIWETKQNNKVRLKDGKGNGVSDWGGGEEPLLDPVIIPSRVMDGMATGTNRGGGGRGAKGLKGFGGKTKWKRRGKGEKCRCKTQKN